MKKEMEWWYKEREREKRRGKGVRAPTETRGSVWRGGAIYRWRESPVLNAEKRDVVSLDDRHSSKGSRR